MKNFNAIAGYTALNVLINFSGYGMINKMNERISINENRNSVPTQEVMNNQNEADNDIGGIVNIPAVQRNTRADIIQTIERTAGGAPRGINHRSNVNEEHNNEKRNEEVDQSLPQNAVTINAASSRRSPKKRPPSSLVKGDTVVPEQNKPKEQSEANVSAQPTRRSTRNETRNSPSPLASGDTVVPEQNKPGEQSGKSAQLTNNGTQDPVENAEDLQISDLRATYGVQDLISRARNVGFMPLRLTRYEKQCLFDKFANKILFDNELIEDWSVIGNPCSKYLRIGSDNHSPISYLVKLDCVVKLSYSRA